MKEMNLYVIISTFLTISWYNIGSVECIVGGTDVNVNEKIPTISLRADGKHICSGSIITSQHVLTAASCVLDLDNNFRQAKYTIVGGVIDTSNENDPNRVVEEVEKIYVPKMFNPKPLTMKYPDQYIDKGNIAVLKLKKLLPFSRNKALGFLNYPNKSRTLTAYIKEKPVVVGFGIQDVNNREYEGDDTVHSCNHCTKLKSAETNIVDKRVCKRYSVDPLQDNHICGQVTQHPPFAGTCDGDIGSPLILKNNVVIGVLIGSRSDCNESNGIALYTKVAPMMSFVYDAQYERSFTNLRTAFYSKASDSKNDEAEKLIEYYAFL